MSIREIIGTEPIKNDDGTYSPSKAAMLTAVPQTTDYHPDESEQPLDDGVDRRVLFLCTEDSTLTCTNDKVFKTGDHPTEVFVVALHLERAGFSVDFATPTGKPVPLEMFAVPSKDSITSDAIAAHRDKLDNPLSMSAVLADLDDNSPYVAVFLPGGHGATQGVPFSTDTKGVLQWFLAKDKHIVTICHGPALLLALSLDEAPDAFPLKGLQIVAFPDAGDRMLATAGYLPGQMPYFFGEKLEQLGVQILNHLPTGSTHVDGKVISGDSPYAADRVGRMAASTLLAEARGTTTDTAPTAAASTD